MASIEEALYAKLTATAGVTSLVGTRIYPTGSAQATDPSQTYLTYERATGQPYHTHDGPGGLRWARLTYMAHSPSYATAKAVAAAVLAALDGFTGTVGTVRIEAVRSESDMIDDYDPETRQQLVMTDLMVSYKIGG